jgi:hypothetical protein
MGNDLRYIVFLLDDRMSQYLDGKLVDGMSTGKIYTSLPDARSYATTSVDDDECKRFVIGSFVLDAQAEIMQIHTVETFGFRHDKTNVN